MTDIVTQPTTGRRQPGRQTTPNWERVLNHEALEKKLRENRELESLKYERSLAARLAESKNGHAKPETVQVPDLDGFLRDGGMLAVEKKVAAKVAEPAIRAERARFLPIMEGWLSQCSDDQREQLQAELKRLKRCLKVYPTTKEARTRTRDRVRRFRERKKAEPLESQQGPPLNFDDVPHNTPEIEKGSPEQIRSGNSQEN